MTKFFKLTRDENFTNINNTNYTNYTNNLTTTNNTNFTLCMTKKKANADTPSGTSALASLSRPLDSPGVLEEVCVGMPEEVLPLAWKGLKIDLFDNAANGSNQKSLKIKLGIIKKDSTTQSLVASMNSPTSYVWRQVSDVDYNNAHWSTVRNIQERFDQQNIIYRVSKCTLPSKGGSTEVVVFLRESNYNWFISVVREAQEFEYTISKNCPLSNAQRMNNIIASKFIGQQARPLISCKELGI
jgi:hypothetical protein